MLLSMTGFGSAHGQVDGVEYAIETRSVNNRYLKISLKLPEPWASAEGEFEKRVRGRLRRGTVTLSVRMKVPQDLAAYRVNTAAVRQYVDQLRELETDRADSLLRIDLGALLALPGVCEPPPLEELCERTHEGLVALVDQALAGLIDMRREEGRALEADLLGNCDVVERNLALVAGRCDVVVQEYHDRLAARVAELTNAGRINVDEDILAREVAIFAERCDVAEEVSRLTGHITQFREALDAGEPIGRKLDFIAQEMLREANTIASKSNDTEIARAVVDVKTAIDRIKEQVQNVE
jgi:uncharacterized protein (TIGR00255 family)